MLEKLKNFLLQNPTGRVILGALLLMGVAYLAKALYVERRTEERTRDRRTAVGRMEAIADRLETAAAESDDPEAYVDGLPMLTDWFPTDIPCGHTRQLDAPKPDSFWGQVEFPTDEALGLQYRFERDGTDFVLLARRDSDCDGLYFTVRLSGSLDWRATLGTDVHFDNHGE